MAVSVDCCAGEVGDGGGAECWWSRWFAVLSVDGGVGSVELNCSCDCRAAVYPDYEA